MERRHIGQRGRAEPHRPAGQPGNIGGGERAGPHRLAAQSGDIGRRAEDIAADFLLAQGLEIVVRNYRRRLGELDLVARKDDVLVVAEVRTRSSDAYGGAAASVTGRKQQRITRATMQLLQRNKDLAGYRVRFDVIVVSDLQAVKPRVEWLKHAFEARG